MPHPPIVRRVEQPPVRTFAAGETIFRQGDPPGPMYLIRSGAVRVSRHVPGSEQLTVELARLGPGEHFGEMASLLAEPRSASVQAVLPTEAVELSASHMRSFMRSNAAFARSIARSLMDRAGLSAAQAIAATTREASGGSPAAARRADGNEAESAPLPVPAHDPGVLYVKEVTCPACGVTFFSLRVRPSKDTPYSTDTDFHEWYRTPQNPHDYAVWVCPQDLYASLPDDFADLTPEQRSRVPAVVSQVVETLWRGVKPDFNVQRGLDLRERSLHLALALYAMREAAPQRVAAIQHRLAWCARERHDLEEEQRWLREALASYRQTYTYEDLGPPKTEIRLTYLLGELAFRVGELEEAVSWFFQVTRHPAIHDFPVWERKARERWALAREAADARAATA